MMLSDRSIREALESGRLAIEPLAEDALQPASVDVRLGGGFLTFRQHRDACIDVRESAADLMREEAIGENEPFVLHPGDFVLGATLERVRLGDDLVARVEGKSSLGRLGLLVHATAGYVDPGWNGRLTLELSNVSRLPVRLYRGMKIGQLAFVNLSTPADAPYGSPSLRSKYQGQDGPSASLSHRDYAPARETAP